MRAVFQFPASITAVVADLFKFDTVVPEAFRVAGLHASDRLRGGDPVREVRIQFGVAGPSPSPAASRRPAWLHEDDRRAIF